MSEEFERLKEALRKAPTPEARKEAAEALRRYLARKGAQRSKPTLVTLRIGGGKTNAIPLDELPDEMIRNPEVYERVRKIITREG